MLDYSFIEILETFSREELKKFKKFILSPYFNTSPKVVKLFEALTKHHPNYGHSSLTKEKFHKKISPELEYNDITMRRLLFDLQNLTEKFIQQLNFERKNIEARTFMVEELVLRGASRMLKKNYKASQRLITETGHINSDICLSKFRFETDTFYHGMIHNKTNRKAFINEESNRLIKGITYLINYFMLEAVKHSETLLTYSRTYNIRNNEKIISEFLDMFDFERLGSFLQKNSEIGSNLVDVYISALKSFLYFNEEKHYWNFKSSLCSNLEKFNLADINFLFGKLIEYCVAKTMYLPGIDPIFDNELFEIYRTMVSKKYYETETNKYFPPDLYRNIIIQSTKVNELSWLEDFIQNYGMYLHPERKSDIINFSYAHLYFERNVYEKSLEFLSRIKMEEFSYAIDAKCLYVKNYYEQEDYDAAYSYIKSFIKFLNESTLLGEYRKKANLNFLKIMTKLINYHSERSKTDLTSLMLQIHKSKELSNRFWLGGKISALQGVKKRAAL